MFLHKIPVSTHYSLYFIIDVHEHEFMKMKFRDGCKMYFILFDVCHNHLQNSPLGQRSQWFWKARNAL